MTKTRKIAYWIATLWLASGMLSTGVLQLCKARVEGALAPPGVYGITHLGYPVYFLTLLFGKFLELWRCSLPSFLC